VAADRLLRLRDCYYRVPCYGLAGPHQRLVIPDDLLRDYGSVDLHAADIRYHVRRHADPDVRSNRYVALMARVLLSPPTSYRRALSGRLPEVAWS
jgi:hypothetical protein